MSSLIQDLNREFITDLDTNPNLSRSAKRPALSPGVRAGSVESALIIGGSMQETWPTRHPLWELRLTSW
jgi:hypothetical protein